MPSDRGQCYTEPLRPCHISLALLLLMTLVLVAGCPRPVPDRGARSKADQRLHVINFDVGQSDAMLVIYRGRSLLYDAGATMSKQGRQNFRDIARAMREKLGHTNLDYFVVSHYHQDHFGLHGTGVRAGLGDLGLWGLINDEGFTVDTMVDRGFFVIGKKGNTQLHYERALRDWMRTGKVRQRIRVKAKDMIDMGPGLNVEVIAANGNGRLLDMHRRNPEFFKENPPSENDYSVVLKFTLGAFELVTGGDLSGYDVSRRFGPVGVSYNDIESSIAEAIGDIEVYRVNHHGSKNSSNPCFIKVLAPEVSVFSTGINSYGHPDPRVYNALRKHGRVYITGGADDEVYGQMKDDIVEKDVLILVPPGGKTFTVDGEKFKARTEAQERARPGYAANCPNPVPTKKSYRMEEGEHHGD